MVENKIILRMTIRKIFEVRLKKSLDGFPGSSENLSGYLNFLGNEKKNYFLATEIFF